MDQFIYSLNTWQTSLRKQYMKRDPEANPIGPEPELKSTELGSVSDSGSPPARDVSEQIDQNTVKKEVTAEPELKDDAVEESENASDSVNVSKNDAGLEDNGQTNSLTTVKVNGIALPAEDLQSAESYPESKDWGDLSMLEKLDSVHTVIEWHFQTPLRLRSLMRSDDDYASWVCECFLSVLYNSNNIPHHSVLNQSDLMRSTIRIGLLEVMIFLRLDKSIL